MGEWMRRRSIPAAQVRAPAGSGDANRLAPEVRIESRLVLVQQRGHWPDRAYAHHVRSVAEAGVLVPVVLEIGSLVTGGYHYEHSFLLRVIKDPVDQAHQSPGAGFGKCAAETHVGNIRIVIGSPKDAAQNLAESSNTIRAKNLDADQSRS